MTAPLTAPMTAAEASRWVDRIIDETLRRRDELGELDRRSGDGDFGSNVAVAVERARAGLAERPATSVADPFLRVADGFATIGGTSGPLLAAWFHAFAGELSARSGTSELAAGAAAGLAVVQRLGRSRPGHRTMVDALAPAADALADARDDRAPWPVALHAAAGAAADGAHRTASMVGRRGRASYLGATTDGVIDPGAEFVALVFTAAQAARPIPVAGCRPNPAAATLRPTD